MSDIIMTAEQFLANREEAGLAIYVETCELGRWAAYDLDPYGILDLPEELRQVSNNNFFVRSPASNGWISELSLPLEKRKALYDRIERESGHPDDAARLKATRAGYADDDVPF